MTKKLKILSALTLGFSVIISGALAFSIGNANIAYAACTSISTSLNYLATDGAAAPASVARPAKYKYPLLTKALRQGMSDPEVVTLKKFLISEGILVADVAVTEFYGPKTEAAVKTFQARDGIASSGSPTTNGFGAVGPKTRAVINKYSTTVSSVSGQSAGGQVSLLQSFLYGAGYLSVGPTGYFGSKTLAAVKKFQAANGLPATGFVGPLTKAKIQSVSCNGPVYVPPQGGIIIPPPIYYPPSGGGGGGEGGGGGGGGGTTVTSSITINSPTAGQTLRRGDNSIDITWSSSAVSSSVIIELRKAGATYNVISASAPNNGAYTFQIPASFVPGGDYQVRITDAANSGVYRDSGTFTIAESLLKAKSITSFNFTNPSATGAIDEVNKRIVLTVPYGTNLTLTPTIVVTPNATVLPLSNVPQTFSATVPKNYVVKAQDNTTQTYAVTVVYAAASSAKALLTFSFANPAVTGNVDEANHAVNVSVPFGTVLNPMTPTITVSPNATILPLTNTPQNFTAVKDYVVKAQDNTTQTYHVKVTPGAGSPAKSILTFNFTNPAVTGSVNETAHTISLTVPFGTATSSLTPVITLSPNATVVPATNVAQDFRTPKTYTVKAQDNTTQTYVATVSVVSGASAKVMNSFDFGAQGATGVMDQVNHTVSVTVPFGVSRASLIPTISISPLATVLPATNVAQDFRTPKTYTVKAQDNSIQVYTVTVTNASPGSSNTITSFDFTNPSAIGVVGDTCVPWRPPLALITQCPITLTVPFGTPITSRVPSIVLPPGATISPTASTPRNFAATTPVDYIVTAQDGWQRTYRVTVNVVPPSTDNSILTFSFPSRNATGTIDEPTRSINVFFPYGTVVTALTPAITISPLATISPLSGTQQNFSPYKAYTVTAQSGATKTYKVFPSWFPAETAKAITGFSFAAVPNATTTIDEINHTISVILPFGTSLTLTPTVTISQYAKVAPLSGVSQVFSTSTPKNYVVTAENTTTQTYPVSVSVSPGSSAKAITSFSFAAVPGATSVINETYHTVTLTLPPGTDRSSLVPTIVVSPGATVSPLSGVQKDFTNTVAYVVKDQNGIPQTYNVTANVLPGSSERAMLTFNSGSSIGVIDENAKTITLTLPHGTNLSFIRPTITVSPYATVIPASGSFLNQAGGSLYTVTAQSGAYAQYRLTVIVP